MVVCPTGDDEPLTLDPDPAVARMRGLDVLDHVRRPARDPDVAAHVPRAPDADARRVHPAAVHPAPRHL